jgi:hypothetical protein
MLGMFDVPPSQSFGRSSRRQATVKTRMLYPREKLADFVAAA